MSMQRWSWFLVLMSLGACYTTSPSAPRTGERGSTEERLEPAGEAAPATSAREAEARDRTSDRPVEITLKVEALPLNGRPRTIGPNAPLRTGDRMVLYVTVDERSYVYVGHRDPVGRKDILFPDHEDELLDAHAVRRIPANGAFELDRKAGPEDLFVYASRVQLTNKQAMQLLDEDSTRLASGSSGGGVREHAEHGEHARVEHHAREHAGPGELTPTNRGVRGLKKVSDESVTTSGSGEDLTTAFFRIQHER